MSRNQAESQPLAEEPAVPAKVDLIAERRRAKALKVISTLVKMTFLLNAGLVVGCKDG